VCVCVCVCVYVCMQLCVTVHVWQQYDTSYNAKHMYIMHIVLHLPLANNFLIAVAEANTVDGCGDNKLLIISCMVGTY